MTAQRPSGRPPLLPLEVLRRIHELALAGVPDPRISDALNAAGVPTPAGEGRWTRVHVWRQRRTARYTALDLAGCGQHQAA